MALKWVVIFVLLDICVQRADAALNSYVVTSSTKAIIFRWDKIVTATSYQISVNNKATGAQAGFASLNANIVMTSIIGLTSNTEYTYTITAINASGTVESESGERITAPDPVPGSLTVTPLSSTTVEIAFTEVATVSNYVVRTHKPGDPSFIKLDSASSSPATVTGLDPYTQYEFRIQASNMGGESQPTSGHQAWTLMAPPEIESSSPTNNSIEVTWTAITDAVEYTVTLVKHGAFPNETMKEIVDGTSVTFSGLIPGALYHIEAFAFDPQDREGETSAQVNQTTRPPAPDSVVVVMTTTNDQPSLFVSWTMDPDVYGELQYNVTSDLGQSSSSYVVFTLLWPVGCGETHTVTVIAINDAGPSIASISATFITVPCPPQNLSITKTGSVCDFTWDTDSHADGYNAYIKNIDGVEMNCNTTTATHCSFTCNCGYTYYMSVFAHNHAGLSQQGPVLNYTTIPCCPTGMNVSLENTETLEIEWFAARGAHMYETRANDSSGVILCNDTAPACVLSALDCDTSYSVKVIPCNDISGCNHNCPTLTRETAACMPTGLTLTKVNSSTATVSWTSSNQAASFVVTAKGDGGDVQTCVSPGATTCDLSNLLCGSTYEVGVTANTLAGDSLPSYTKFHETEPCCPSTLSVTQVTQSATNVSWSEAKGAHTFLTSLDSSKGHARCHTEDMHCLMGCITCGTNYTVTMEAFSESGLKADCSYQGFSSSLCCPTGIRIYRTDMTALRVTWRPTGASHITEVEIKGPSNYTCRSVLGDAHCDVTGVQCGSDYTVEVAPVKADGSLVDFCPKRKVAVQCAGPNVGAILHRRRRSLK